MRLLWKNWCKWLKIAVRVRFSSKEVGNSPDIMQDILKLKETSYYNILPTSWQFGNFYFTLMVLLFHLKSQMEVLKYIRSVLNVWKCPQNQENQQNINFCVFYLIPPSRNIFVQSEWSVSYLCPNWDAFSAASEND